MLSPDPAPLSYRQAAIQVVVVALDDGAPGTEQAQRVGLAAAEIEMLGRGWECLSVPLGLGPVEAARLAEILLDNRPDCVVVAAPVRLPMDRLETVVEVVRRCAPSSALAFAATPCQAPDAAARWL